MESDNEEKLFSLQIQIQKLEEELTLYRNGASGQELFEVIGEKNTEISELKDTLSAKTENLKKLAKSSSDVIAQYNTLQESFEKLKAEKETIQDLATVQEKEIETLRENYAAQVTKISKLEEESSFKQQKLVDMEQELIDSNVTIEKLHQRGAMLVAEKTERTKSLKSTTNDMDKLKKKLQVMVILHLIPNKLDYWCAQNEISSLTAELTAERQKYATEVEAKDKLNKQYEESQDMIRSVREAIVAAQKTNEVAKTDMKRIQESYQCKIQKLKDQMAQDKVESHEKLKQVCWSHIYIQISTI